MCDILPGILEKDWSAIERKLEALKPFATSVHIDLLDGKFAPNTTLLDPEPFKKYKDTFLLEVHMMVKEPIDYLDQWAKAGFRRFVGHVEHMSDQEAFVAKGEEIGEVGLAIDAKTPVSAITVPYTDLDAILVMTVNAGFSGQTFIKESLKKVKEIRDKDFLEVIEIDGGVTDVIMPDALTAGANRFVATSFLFTSQNPKEQYNLLRKAC
jgi:ribulose-phosphate 3-epimerase